MAAHHLDLMRRLQADGPYYLGGYCFGGLIAFEMAHHLKASGAEVGLLMVLEPSPLERCGVSSLLPLPSDARPRSICERTSRHAQALKTLKSSQRLAYVARGVQGKVSAWLSPLRGAGKNALCRTYHWLRIPLPRSLRSFYILGVYRRARAHYALRTYPGPVTLFVAADSPHNRPSWEGLATGAIDIYNVPGDHHSVLRDPHSVRAWAGILQRCLDSARRRQAADSSACVPSAADEQRIDEVVTRRPAIEAVSAGESCAAAGSVLPSSDPGHR